MSGGLICPLFPFTSGYDELVEIHLPDPQSPELWESGKRVPRFPSLPFFGKRLFHSPWLPASQTRLASDSPNCYADVPRCTPSSTLRSFASRIEQVLKPAYVQTLFSQSSVKTFYSRVLRRLARLYMHQLDLPLYGPRQKMPAGKLWPVVAANRFRHPALGDDCIQYPRHSAAGETGIHFQRQTFPRIGIHHAQHPDRPSAFHRIVHEIQRPLLVRRSPRL